MSKKIISSILFLAGVNFALADVQKFIPDFNINMYDATLNPADLTIPALALQKLIENDNALKDIVDFNMSLYKPTYNEKQSEIPALWLEPDITGPKLTVLKVKKETRLKVKSSADTTLYYSVLTQNGLTPTVEDVKDGHKAVTFDNAEIKANEEKTFDLKDIESNTPYDLYLATSKVEDSSSFIIGNAEIKDSVVDAPTNTSNFKWSVTKASWNMLSVPNGLSTKESDVASNRYVYLAYTFDKDRGFKKLSRYSDTTLDSTQGIFVYISKELQESEVTINSQSGKLFQKADMFENWKSVAVNRWHLLGVQTDIEWLNPTDKNVLNPQNGCSTFDMYQFNPKSTVWNDMKSLSSGSAIWLYQRCGE